MQLNAKSLCMHNVTGDNCPSSSYSLQKLLHPCAEGFVTNELLDLHRLDELKNFVVNIFLKVGVLVTYLDLCIDWLVTYWEPCIEKRDCHYITSPIGYWGKGSTLGWYQVLEFFLLVTACFDNSGLSGVMTLNSPGGVLPWWFFPFVNKSSVLYLFYVAFNLVGDLFVLPHLLHVIEFN